MTLPWVSRVREAITAALTPPPPPGRLEQLEQRLREVEAGACDDRTLAGLLSSVAEARREAGRLEGAREAYERARALYEASGAPGWMAARMAERLDALAGGGAVGGPYREGEAPVIWVRHGEVWHRFRQRVVVLGRGAPGQTDLCLPSGTVTRVHAVISHEDGRYVLRDRGSDNGTYLASRVGGEVSTQRLTGEHVLSDGDELWMGDQSVVVALTEPAGAR
jgi:hypothetical protein